MAEKKGLRYIPSHGYFFFFFNTLATLHFQHNNVHEYDFVRTVARIIYTSRPGFKLLG